MKSGLAIFFISCINIHSKEGGGAGRSSGSWNVVHILGSFDENKNEV